MSACKIHVSEIMNPEGLVLFSKKANITIVKKYDRLFVAELFFTTIFSLLIDCK